MAAWLDGLFGRKDTPAPQSNTAPAPKPPASKPQPTPKVRTVFMGTPHLAAVMLDALIREKYHLVGVVTQPDKPVGRKKELQESDVKKLAREHGLPIEQPVKMDAEAIQKIASWKPDLIIVAAYGKILPEAVLKLPGFGALNVHASLLPRFRGASPIQNALIAGDTETGVTLMVMDKGMDTGDMIATKRVAIDPDDTQETLLPKIEQAGAALLIETLPLWVRRKITATPQPSDGIVLCQLIEREDGHVIFTDTARNIYNRYRALTPWPGIFAFWKKGGVLQRIKLTRISFREDAGKAAYGLGEVFQEGERVGVQTSAGAIFIETIQPEGKSAMPIADFLRGNADFIHSFLQ